MEAHLPTGSVWQYEPKLDGFRALPSHRQPGLVQVGSVTRSSRLAKWNQLLRIEQELPGGYLGAAGLEARTR